MPNSRNAVPRWISAAALVLVTATGISAFVSSAAAANIPGSSTSQGETAENLLTRDNVDAWLDDLVGSAIETTGIPGATVSVVANGQVLTDVQKTLRLLISYRQPGGRRAYDEPTEAAQAEKEEEEPH